MTAPSIYSCAEGQLWGGICQRRQLAYCVEKRGYVDVKIEILPT